MKTMDRLTPELRKIEQEIDNYYKSYPLVKLPFATAAWSLLAFGETHVLSERPDGIQDFQRQVTDFVSELKHPLRWLYDACTRTDQFSVAYNDSLFKASWDLFKLGQDYDWFVLAYTYASCGEIKLILRNSTIQPTEDFYDGIEYEVYNRLSEPNKSLEAMSAVNPSRFPFDTIKQSVTIRGDRFSHQLNPKLVATTITAMEPIFDSMFMLPSEWEFSHYTLGEFRRAFEVISAMAAIRLIARRIAITQGCPGKGHTDGVYVVRFDELLRQVVRCSNVPESKVHCILDDLCFGNRNVSNPDPVLQPLIKLNSDICAIAPNLWLCLSAERNLAVLFNRLPTEKMIYSKLVFEKENLMRRRFTTGLSAQGFRFVSGNVQGLPDVDLAIIKDSEKTCLLIELKWFIGPSEPREIIQKSEEIKKGISQSLILKRAFSINHTSLLERLQIDSGYRLEAVVVSENWVGYANVQNPEIPVILADHLIAKLKCTKDLQSTVEWLNARKYLPKKGVHFEIANHPATIGKWTVDWYEIRLFIRDAFFPL